MKISRRGLLKSAVTVAAAQLTEIPARVALGATVEAPDGTFWDRGTFTYIGDERYLNRCKSKWNIGDLWINGDCEYFRFNGGKWVELKGDFLQS